MGASVAAHATERPPPDALVRLAGQCVLAGFHGVRVPQVLIDRMRIDALGGVLVTAGNFGDLNSLKTLTRVVRACGELPPLIAADQEGGPVSHLSPPLAPMVSMPLLGALDDVELTRRAGAVMGFALRDAGINFDLAPVLDVRTNRDNYVVLGRTFGSVDRVARHGVALVEGLRSSGVMPCAKHFPGHGATREDSHELLPRVPHDRARLEAVDLVPFRAAMASLPAMMVSHVVYEGIDRERPASLSARVTDGLLRQTLGYQGVAISDDLEMAPIRDGFGVPAAAILAVEAGCDLALIAHTVERTVAAIDAMARYAQTHDGFRQRLTASAARVRAMREAVRAMERVPQNPYGEDPRRFWAEVNARRQDRSFRDPTR